MLGGRALGSCSKVTSAARTGCRALAALVAREGDARQPGRASVQWVFRKKHDHWSGVHCRVAANSQQRRQCRKQLGWGSDLGLAVSVLPLTSRVMLGTSLSLSSLSKTGNNQRSCSLGWLWDTRDGTGCSVVCFSGPFWFPDAHPHPSLFLSSSSDSSPKHPKPFVHFLPQLPAPPDSRRLPTMQLNANLSLVILLITSLIALLVQLGQNETSRVAMKK